MGHVHVIICSTDHRFAGLRTHGEPTSLPIQVRRRPRLFDDARGRLRRNCLTRMACRPAACGDRKAGRIEFRSSLATGARGTAGTASGTGDDAARVRRRTPDSCSAACLCAGPGAAPTNAMQQPAAAQILCGRQRHHSHLFQRLCLPSGDARAVSAGGRLSGRATGVGATCARHGCGRRTGWHGHLDERCSGFPPGHQQSARITVVRSSVASASHLLGRLYRHRPSEPGLARLCVRVSRKRSRHRPRIDARQILDHPFS